MGCWTVIDLPCSLPRCCEYSAPIIAAVSARTARLNSRHVTRYGNLVQFITSSRYPPHILPEIPRQWCYSDKLLESGRGDVRRFEFERSHRGRILYVGITSDPFRRVTDHTSSGKEFKTLTVETPPMGRREEEKW